jgi:hypothetical protein
MIENASGNGKGPHLIMQKQNDMNADIVMKVED